MSLYHGQMKKKHFSENGIIAFPGRPERADFRGAEMLLYRAGLKEPVFYGAEKSLFRAGLKVRIFGE